MKKIILSACLFLLIFSLIPSLASAYTPLVPCGHRDAEPNQAGIQDPYPDTEFNEACSCTLCHFFILFKNAIDFLLFRIVPPVAILMLVIGGIMFFGAGANPANLEKAKKLITNVVFGLAIIFSAWIIINTFIMMIGIQEWTGLQTWWQVDCPVPDASTDINNNCILDVKEAE